MNRTTNGEQFQNRKSIGYLRRRKTGEEVCIDRIEWHVGKKEEINDYVIKENRAVSRKHACIYWEEERYYIVDLGSVNGTYINSQEIEINQKAELHNGDKVVFANELFQFVIKVKNEIPKKALEKKTEERNVVTARTQKRKQQYPMKWYYFIIHIQLIFGVVSLAAIGFLYISGEYLELNYDMLFKEGVYIKVPGLKYMDIGIGVINLGLIPACLITRQKLVNFKKDAPKWYMGILVGNLVSYVLINISASMYVEVSVISFGIGMAVFIALIVANYMYFNKRKVLFHNKRIYPLYDHQ